MFMIQHFLHICRPFNVLTGRLICHLVALRQSFGEPALRAETVESGGAAESWAVPTWKWCLIPFFQHLRNFLAITVTVYHISFVSIQYWSEDRLTRFAEDPYSSCIIQLIKM
jgi:hypothetical protein